MLTCLYGDVLTTETSSPTTPPFIYVLTHNRTYFQSLVDQCDNGGVVGEDVSVGNTSPYRHVDIRGIDNYEINSVPIATVGSLAHSKAISVTSLLY